MCIRDSSGTECNNVGIVVFFYQPRSCRVGAHCCTPVSYTHLNQSYIRKTVCSFHDVFIANPAYFNLKQQEIALEDLQQYPILMLDRKSTTSEFLHNLFLQHQLELMPQIELSSNDLLIDLARIGLGLSLIHILYLRQIQRRDRRDSKTSD